jgi:thiol-disulfide isomerase/thioredoxin
MSAFAQNGCVLRGIPFPDLRLAPFSGLVVRAPVDTIAAPLFPTKLPWVNTSGTQASILKRGQPMLVEFWDFCRPNSIRTLPYVKAWHERYANEGLRVIGVHCPGFAPSHPEQAVRDAVERLEIAHPVLIDSEFEVWQEYENRGWPARYLFDGRARLFDYHYGEGAYVETELAIQELLDVQREPLGPLRPEDAPDAQLLPQSAEQAGAWSGPYEAGSVWVVLDGSGTVTVGAADSESESDLTEGRTLNIECPGAYKLIEHARHTRGMLTLDLGTGVECLATCFTPGVA